MVIKILSLSPFPQRPLVFVQYLVVSTLSLYALFSFHRSSRDTYSGLVLLRPLPDLPLTSESMLSKIASKFTGNDQSSAQKPVTWPPINPSQHRHPIDKLIYDAQETFSKLIYKETYTVEQAAKVYRERRGRHPPPGFDRWHDFARSRNAVIIEDFFDQIYHDIEPFWGIEPLYLRRQVSQAGMTINVREGNASAESDWFWTQIWLKMIKEIDVYLPDMDIPLNAMDEPRLIVPWEDLDGYMKKAAKTIILPTTETVNSSFQKLPAPQTGELGIQVPNIEWEDTSKSTDGYTRASYFKLTYGKEPYWSIVRRGCPPDTPAREEALQTSFNSPPMISNKYALTHLYDGYVANYTKSIELCHQPDLQGLEGILIEPISISATKTMFPMFGGSKLTVNNDILLPAPMYWSEDERFTGNGDPGIPWAQKSNKAIWRGVASGGKNRETNWRGFQRHRFVSMSNGSKVAQVESHETIAEDFTLPDEKEYNISPQKEKRLGAWISGFSDVAFVDLSCDPPQDGKCNYTDFYYETKPTMRLAEQFESKFLPDIDGNSFSGRYLGFLRSTSLPIKATIWREWHDSRLVPWKHFVPMDNRFSDYYGIMEYFLGYQGHHGHDATAEKIATDGKEWAERVLRKDDMLVYVMRLLLEYARVLDDRRESLGWVDDLLKAREKTQ